MKLFKGLIPFLLIYGLSAEAQNILVALDSANIPDVELGEVVIAASRDNTVIKEVPGAVTSIRTSCLENNQIQSLEDLTGFAPNFMMLDYGTKLISPVYIRGVGSKKSSVAPSVGLYVDGIPYFDNSALSFDFYDISQVEILRGPQGTLYGRNAIGGLVNITTLSPINYQGTRLRLTSATYNNYNATISHYKRIGDKFAFSLAGNYNYQGGYFTNQHKGKKADKSESFGFRNRLIYRLNNKITIENIAGVEQSKQFGYPYSSYTDSTDLTDINYNEESGYERLMFNDGLNLKYDDKKIAGQLTISYHLIDDKQTIDQDFSPDTIYLVTQEQKQNMFTSEAVVHSKNKTGYNWLIGAFNNMQLMDKLVRLDKTKSLYFYEKDYAQTNSSTGLFHQSKLNLYDKMTLTAGFRLNNESSQLDYNYYQSIAGNETVLMDTSFAALKEWAFLPKATIQYHFSHSTLYGSYTTGYKPGGFNVTFEENDQIQFGKEESDNFEFGLKTDILNGLIYSDIAFFYSKISGQHILRALSRGSYIDNSGKSENKGFEFSLQTAPINGFESSVNYGYTEAIITDYQEDETTNYNGNISPYVPNHTLNIMVAQTLETKTINYLDNIKFQVNFQQIGDIYWNLENTQMSEAYNLVNAVVSFNYNDFKLDLWGKNLFDTQYKAYLFSAFSSWYGQAGPPQRFGATLSLNL